MEIKSINSSLAESNLFANNKTNFDNSKYSDKNTKINNNINSIKELAMDDMDKYSSDYTTIINTNSNNSETDYNSKIKNLNAYKENQSKTIEIIESEEKDIRNIVDDSYTYGYDILKSDYEKIALDINNEKNSIFSNYLEALTNGSYNNHYNEVIKKSGLTKDKLLSMNYEDAIDLILQNDNDAKEIIDSYEELIKSKFSNVIESLNKNGYNIKNMSSLIDYINYLDNQKKQTKSLIIEADKTLKILPYLDITNKDEYKNYEDNNLIDENILNLSFDGDNYSYSKYLSQKNISPADFLKQIEENDTYYDRGFALSEKNFDVNKLHNLIEASKSNSDLLKLYNYLYYNKGIDAANKYLNDIEEEVNKSIALKHVIEFSNKLNDGQNIDDAANRTLTITGKGLTDGLEQFNNGLIYWFSDNPNRTVSDYETMYISLLLQPENIKKQAGLIDENGKSTSPIDFSKDYSGNLNISDDVYAISTSIGNMLPSMMLSAVNPMIGTAALGITAGGNSYHERIIEGSDKGTAIAYGALSGLSEAALERVLGTLPGLSNTEVISLKDLLKAMPQEALEEGTQELFDIGLSHALYGEEISLEDAIARVGKSAIYGAIISGIMNTPGATVNSATNILENTNESRVIEAAKKYGINMTESEATEFLNYEKTTSKTEKLKINTNSEIKQNNESPNINITSEKNNKNNANEFFSLPNDFLMPAAGELDSPVNKIVKKEKIHSPTSINSETITEIPNTFLDETGILKESQTARETFIEQMNRYNEARKEKINHNGPLVDENGKVILPKGSLFHGMGKFNEDTIKSISNDGIVTGQAIGKEEDGETFYCADFYRTPTTQSLSQLSTIVGDEIQGRTPFGEKKYHDNKMGFIVEPTTNPKLQQLLEYDIYRNNTEESKIAQQYVNMAGLPFETSETASSILYGVPSNAISGIVVGNELAQNKEKIEIIKKYFPNSYITTQYGVLIYNPN